MNTTGGIIYEPILPPIVIALITIVLLLATVRIYWRVGKSIERWRTILLTLFRLAGIALVILLLLQPSRREILPPPIRDRVTLVGVDSSASMKQRDAGSKTRLDAAKDLLANANIVGQNGIASAPRLRLFEFRDDARPVQ